MTTDSGKSGTPRTDAQAQGAIFYVKDFGEAAIIVPGELSRTLERELTAMTARCEKAEREAELLSAAGDAVHKLIECEKELAAAEAALADSHDTISTAQDILCAALGSSVKHDRGGLLPHATQVARELTDSRRANAMLRTALERSVSGLQGAWSKTPVRDVAETLAEGNAALSATSADHKAYEDSLFGEAVYAVRMDTGHWVGIWNARDIAQRFIDKAPAREGRELVELFAKSKPKGGA